jgi:hypothetical protein
MEKLVTVGAGPGWAITNAVSTWVMPSAVRRATTGTPNPGARAVTSPVALTDNTSVLPEMNVGAGRPSSNAPVGVRGTAVNWMV